MDIRRGRSAALGQGNPFGLRFLYDFADASGQAMSLGPLGSPIRLNSSWQAAPVAGLGVGIRPVANVSTGSYLDTGILASALGWDQSTGQRSIILVARLGTEYLGNGGAAMPVYLSAGPASGTTGYFSIARANFSTAGLSVSYYGGPDFSVAQFGGEAIAGAYMVMAYAFDGTTHTAVTACHSTEGVLTKIVTNTITNASNVAIGTGTSLRIGIDPGNFPGRYWPSGTSDALMMVGGASVAWSESLMRRLVLDPWGALSSPRRRVAVAAGAPAGVSLQPAPVALSLAGYTPFVARTQSLSLQPGSTGLTLSTFGPTVTRTASVSLIPDAVQLSLSVYTPTLVLTTNSGLSPSVAALSLLTFTPTVSQSAGLVLSPVPAAVSVASFTPNLVRTTNSSLSPAAASFALATFAPGVLQSNGLTLSPVPAYLATGGPTPTVSTTNNVSLSPALATLTVLGFVPTVSQSTALILTPATAVLVLSTFSPTMTQGHPVGTVGFAGIGRFTDSVVKVKFSIRRATFTGKNK